MAEDKGVLEKNAEENEKDIVSDINDFIKIQAGISIPYCVQDAARKVIESYRNFKNLF